MHSRKIARTSFENTSPPTLQNLLLHTENTNTTPRISFIRARASRLQSLISEYRKQIQKKKAEHQTIADKAQFDSNAPLFAFFHRFGKEKLLYYMSKYDYIVLLRGALAFVRTQKMTVANEISNYGLALIDTRSTLLFQLPPHVYDSSHHHQQELTFEEAIQLTYTELFAVQDEAINELNVFNSRVMQSTCLFPQFNAKIDESNALLDSIHLLKEEFASQPFE